MVKGKYLVQMINAAQYKASLRQLQFLSVIRLSLGKLLVNLLQVVKRTSTPLIL